MVRNKMRRVTHRSRCSSTGGRQGRHLRAPVCGAPPVMVALLACPCTHGSVVGRSTSSVGEAKMEDVRICGAHLQAGQAVLHRGAAAPGRAVETEQLPRTASWTASWGPRRGQSSEDGAGVRAKLSS